MITFGTDPEFFIVNEETGVPMPACGLIGGTKGEPQDLGDGFAVQEDNVMVEWNTPPVNDPYMFAETVMQGRRIVLDFVRTKMPTGTSTQKSALVFTDAMLESKQAQVFGCSPDYDAHQRGAACAQIDPMQLQTEGGAWRFAGGHLHLGYANPEGIPDFVVAALCDALVGLQSILARDKQGERRTLYGTPGRYRPTPYGIEYRTLSNYWTWDVNRAANIALRAQEVGRIIEGDVNDVQRLYKEIPWDDVQKAILTEDRVLASRLMNYVNRDLQPEALQ